MSSFDRTVSSSERFAFWAILAFAGIVRLKGLTTGLPLHTLYGENDTLKILLQILQKGDLNPHDFTYPGLAYYIYLPFLYLFYGIGTLGKHFTSPSGLPDFSVIFVGRVVSALFGTASVYMIYRIARNFSPITALIAMAVLACTPQHVEFSHMLRPEVPAVFFVLCAHFVALNIVQEPSAKRFVWLGVFTGAAFALKYNIGLPVLVLLPAVCFYRRSAIRWIWPAAALLAFAAVFALSNPYLLSAPAAIPYWMRKVDAFYLPGESYYGKNIVTYYIDFLIRYNYSVPLLVFAGLGFLLGLARERRRTILLSMYPAIILILLCSSGTRRVYGLIPIHAFIALWSGYFLWELWAITRQFSRSPVFRATYGLLLCLVLFWPFYRSLVQTYLFSKVDNRSKAELWMSNFAPKGSKIAVLQFQQVELDSQYFELVDFAPKDYIGSKDFAWFRDHGFDYVVTSSGQYARYFTEGESAANYRSYFLKFFRDGGALGTLVLDLTTHPTLIPDFRIKVWSTRRLHATPEFQPAIDFVPEPAEFHITDPNTILSLRPGYYALELPAHLPPHYWVKVKNLKLNETILRTTDFQELNAEESHRRYPFAIFQVRALSRFSLFEPIQSDLSSTQRVRVSVEGITSGIVFKKIEPALEVNDVSAAVHSFDPALPYISFLKSEVLKAQCTLTNRTNHNVAGYAQTFLSDIGEAEPWKNFESAGDMEEFFLDPGQSITLELPVNTDELTGDHELSYWIFTRQDLPFSPQNGGWFNKQIRVSDPKLGIHPVYGIPIP